MADEEALCQAGIDWRKIYDAGHLAARDLFPGPFFTVKLHFEYDDGSLLRFSDKLNRWQFFETDDRFRRERDLGRA
jgi:hypothetical protein